MIKINYFVRYSQLFLWFAKADNPTCKLLHDYVCTVDKLANNKIVGFERWHAQSRPSHKQPF